MGANLLSSQASSQPSLSTGLQPQQRPLRGPPLVPPSTSASLAYSQQQPISQQQRHSQASLGAFSSAGFPSVGGSAMGGFLGGPGGSQRRPLPDWGLPGLRPQPVSQGSNGSHAYLARAGSMDSLRDSMPFSSPANGLGNGLGNGLPSGFGQATGRAGLSGESLDWVQGLGEEKAAILM